MSKKESKHFISVNNKRYLYTLTPHKGETFFTCPAARISQDFLSEDIPELLVDLPELILSEINYRLKQKDIIRFRVSVDEKKKIMKKALKKGYKNLSSFLRDLALNS